MSERLKPEDLPPGLRIRAGRLHYRFMAAGVAYTGNTHCAVTERGLKRALRILEDARRKVEAGEAESLRLRPRPFNDAALMFNDWRASEHKHKPATARRTRISSVSLCAFFGRTMLHSITPGQVMDYMAWRRSCGIREVTLRHDLHCLSQIFEYARLHNWATKNPVEKVSIPSDKTAVREHVLTPAEEARYFAAARSGSSLYDAARLILLTGMRPSEVLALRIEHCGRGSVTVTSGKTDAARRVLALVPEAAGIVARRRALAVNGWLFAGRGGGMKRLNSAHDRLLGRINAPVKGQAPPQLHFVLYDLRHTFATRMAAAGCPMPTLAAMLGHHDLRTLRRYVHIGQAAQEEAMLRHHWQRDDGKGLEGRA